MFSGTRMLTRRRTSGCREWEPFAAGVRAWHPACDHRPLRRRIHHAENASVRAEDHSVQANQMTEAIRCPRCSHPLPSGSELVGKEFFCTTCGVRLKIAVQQVDALDFGQPFLPTATTEPD